MTLSLLMDHPTQRACCIILVRTQPYRKQLPDGLQEIYAALQQECLIYLQLHSYNVENTEVSYVTFFKNTRPRLFVNLYGMARMTCSCVELTDYHFFVSVCFLVSLKYILAHIRGQTTYPYWWTNR